MFSTETAPKVPEVVWANARPTSGTQRAVSVENTPVPLDSWPPPAENTVWMSAVLRQDEIYSADEVACVRKDTAAAYDRTRRPFEDDRLAGQVEVREPKTRGHVLRPARRDGEAGRTTGVLRPLGDGRHVG